MRLLQSENITSTMTCDFIERTRGDCINPITLEIPPEIGDGPLDEIVTVSTYNGRETLEVENAVTDMIDPFTLVYQGREFRITEGRMSARPGFWSMIKCVRHLTNDEP